MNQIQWKYKLSSGSGQKKNKDDIMVDESTEHKLSMTFKGTEGDLIALAKKIAPMVAKVGGQETLDLEFDD